MNSTGEAGCGRPADDPSGAGERTRVLVVGAGIIGICIAYHLASRGADVTVLDKQSPGSGCTQGAFAMLIASHVHERDVDDVAFNALYGLAVAEWHHLQAHIDEPLHIQWGGVVHWAAPGETAETLAVTCSRLQGWGLQAEALGTADDVTRLVPGAVAGTLGAGSFLPDHGALDIQQTFTILLRRTKALGVQIQTGVEVTGIENDANGRPLLLVASGDAVRSEQYSWPADKIVIAAGAGTSALARAVGAHVPLDIVSGTLAYSKPMPPLLHRVLNGPLGSIRQNPDGRVVTGLDYAPGADGTDVSDTYGQMLLQRAAAVVPALAGMELDHMVVGHVPIPADTRPIVGFCDGPAKTVYVATMMSGITMAPLMGRLVATEILGQSLALLQPYRPDRFSRKAADAKS